MRAALSTHRCKLALHGLAAYLLNAAVYKADVNKDGDSKYSYYAK